MSGLRRYAIVALMIAAACARCQASKTPEVRALPKSHPPPPANSPYEPVPPLVADALAIRDSDRCRALMMLQGVYVGAADAGDLRTVSIALHRAGDIANDSYADCEGFWLDPAFGAGSNLYQRAYVLDRLRGDERLAGLAANDLGIAARHGGTGLDPVEWFSEAVRLRRDAGTAAELQLSLNNLGGALMLYDRGPEAVAALTESLALAADAGNRVAERKVEINLAASELTFKGDEPHQQAAVAHLKRARELMSQTGEDPARVCDGLRTDQIATCEALLK